MSLRRRLIVLIATLMPLSILAGGILTYAYSLRQIEKEMSEALGLAEATVREVVATLPKVADPAGHVAHLVSTFDNDRDVQVSLVSGSEAISISRLAPNSDPPPVWLQRALSIPSQFLDVPLPPGLPVSGVIRVEAIPLGEMTEIWEEMSLQFAIICGFFILASTLVSWTLGRALRPLEKLASALSEVGAGNFAAHVPEGGPEELSSIYRAFNRMTARLNDAERQNKALNEQLLTVQEEERAEIARDLHDEIGPFLFAVDVDAQAIPQYLDKGQREGAAGRSSAIRQSVAHMQTHLRAILKRLRPPVLLDLGLAQAVDQLVDFWRMRNPSIAIKTEMQQASFGTGLDEIAYRTIQEALNNAVRHGRPAKIEIRAMMADRVLTLLIADDGSGFGKNSAPGFGLAGMRERIAAAGGTLDITENRTMSGVTITARLPPPPLTPRRDTATEERITAP